MGQDPFKVMQQAIEEARPAGFAAAFARLEEFMAAHRNANASITTKPQKEPSAPVSVAANGRYRGQHGRFSSSTPFPMTRQLVANALKSMAPRAASPTELRRIAEDAHGSRVASTSVRRALRSLAKEGLIFQPPGTKLWTLGGERNAGQ
jgi:hypothetical protein